jgi:hypothetical protein
MGRLRSHLLSQQSGHVDRLRHLNLPAEGKAKAIVKDQGAILEALERCDPDAAEAALRQHLAGTPPFCAGHPGALPGVDQLRAVNSAGQGRCAGTPAVLAQRKPM